MSKNNKMEEVDVYLRIYDLSNGIAKKISKELIGIQIDGIWHTSIEVFNKEYFYTNGISITEIGKHHYGDCVERLYIGKSNSIENDFEEFIELSRGMWLPDEYDIIEKNCNHYSNYLSFYLLEKQIPQYILDLPNLVKDTEFFKLMFKNK